MTVTSKASAMYRSVPGRARLDKVAKRTAEIAVVGPDIITIDDPNNAAMIAVTIAVYEGRAAIQVDDAPPVPVSAGEKVVVGDISAEALKAALDKHFGDWSGAPTAKIADISKEAPKPGI